MKIFDERNPLMRRCKKKPMRTCLLALPASRQPKPYATSLHGSCCRLLTSSLQEAEKEKESILAQFSDVTRRRIEIDEAQKPHLEELNTVKQKINGFNHRRTEAVVSFISCGFLWVALTPIIRRRLRRLLRLGWPPRAIWIIITKSSQKNRPS
jgi:hypothetical protein